MLRKEARMTNRAWLTVLLLLLCAGIPASAQTTVDVSKITCDQFIRLSVAPPDTIAIWLSGYYHGLQRRTTVDVQKLKAQPQNMTTYCLYQGKGGTVSVMEAAEKVLTSGE
jgi:acid stress chaperone HdeB